MFNICKNTREGTTKLALVEPGCNSIMTYAMLTDVYFNIFLRSGYLCFATQLVLLYRKKHEFSSRN